MNNNPNYPPPQSSSGVGSDAYAQNQQQNGMNQLQQQALTSRMVLNEEEKAVISECRKESYYYRSLPLGIMFGSLAYFGVNRGLLKPNTMMGAGPKVIFFTFLGYLMGKTAYVKPCEEKILQRIPNSNLANMVRKRRGMSLVEVVQDEIQQQQSVEQEVFDNDNSGGQAKNNVPNTSAYDSMRHKNRQHYYNQQIPPQYRQPIQPQQQPEVQSPPPIAAPLGSDSSSYGDPSYAAPSKLKKRNLNKYGDEGFE